MSKNEAADLPRQDWPLVTAAEWFGGGQRIGYDPVSARVLTDQEAAAVPGALRVFERVVAADQHVAAAAERVAAADRDAGTVWLTMMPGWLLWLGAGGPDARRRPRPAAVRGTGGPG